MSDTVKVSFVQQFGRDLMHLVQQKGSKTRPHVRVEKIVGKYDHVDRLGKGEASEILTRHGDTPAPLNLEHSRRRIILRSFEASERTDHADLQRLLLDPTNKYSEALKFALGRKADDIILAALYGNSVAVDGDDAGANVALPAGQIIDEDLVTANSDLTVDKLIEARRLLEAADVDLDAEMPVILADATALNSLLKEVEIASTDYNTVRALVAGKVDTFMGFKFVRVNRLAAASHKTSENFVRALAFVPSALAVRMGRDITVKVGEDPSKRFDKIIYAAMDIGATRVEEEKVVSIECYRA